MLLAYYYSVCILYKCLVCYRYEILNCCLYDFDIVYVSYAAVILLYSSLLKKKLAELTPQLRLEYISSYRL